jgi:hypothetical protein
VFYWSVSRRYILLLRPDVGYVLSLVLGMYIGILDIIQLLSYLVWRMWYVYGWFHLVLQVFVSAYL